MGTPSGLSHIFLELSSRCDKKTLCSVCGHQSQTFNPKLQFGDMDFSLLEKIRAELEPGVDISFHHDGDPLVYDRLSDALDLFDGFVTSIVTHGQSLGKRAKDIIGKTTTVTVSVVTPDPDWNLQIDAISEFISLRGDKIPTVNLKFIGNIPNERISVYENLKLPILRRLLHVPDGNYKYVRNNPTIPEHKICLDMLHSPAVDWKGSVFICNRFNPESEGLIGNLNESSLSDIWNSPKRKRWLEVHKIGRRDLASPLCQNCNYYGVPSG